MKKSPILIHGVDTIKVNVKLLDSSGKPLKQQEVSYKLVDCFEQWQQEAKEQKEPIPTTITFQDARLKMYPNGAPTWKYILRNDCLELKICPRLRVPMVARVTLLSEYLWAIGNVQKAVDEVQDFLLKLFGIPVLLQAAQIDLCVDMVGLKLPAEWEKIFVSNALTKRPIGVSQKDQAYYKGHQLETIIFSGHGNAVNGKLYNKIREIQQHTLDKIWFYDL